MKIYIYQIWFPTSKKSYIGQTKDIKFRMQRHFRSDSLVCKALWKYDDWQVTILHTTNKELANQLEIEDIRNFNSIAPNGYNLTAGGEGGDTFTNNPNKEGIREKNRKFQQGKYVSEETKEKLSKVLQGNKNGEGCKHSKDFIEKMQGNKRSVGKRSGKALVNIQIAQLKRRIREL